MIILPLVLPIWTLFIYSSYRVNGKDLNLQIKAHVCLFPPHKRDCERGQPKRAHRNRFSISPRVSVRLFYFSHTLSHTLVTHRSQQAPNESKPSKLEFINNYPKSRTPDTQSDRFTKLESDTATGKKKWKV